MLSIGLQHKTVDSLTTELDLPSSQILGLFNQLVRRIRNYTYGILEKAIAETLVEPEVSEMRPLSSSIDEDLRKTEKVCILKLKFSSNLICISNS